MDLFIFIWVWTFSCFLVSFVGLNKKIGYWCVFLFSVLLSPLVGLIIAMVSEKNKINYSDKRYHRKHEEGLINHIIPNISFEEWGKNNPNKSLNEYYNEVKIK